MTNDTDNLVNEFEKIKQEKLQKVYAIPKNKEIYESLTTILDAAGKDCDSLDTLREILHQEDNSDNILALVDAITTLPNHPITSVDEVIRASKILRYYLEEEIGYYNVSREIDIQESLLSYINGSDYYNTDKKFWNLSVITDTDFVDSQYFEGDEYQIVYGTLYNAEDCAELYNFIAAMCNTAKAPILRKAWIDTLIKAIKAVIANLEKCKVHNKGEEIRVFIPFAEQYERTISSTIDLFGFTLNVLKQIRECDLVEIPLETTSGNTYPIPKMDDLMESLALGDGVVEEEFAGIVFDEMARRGLMHNRVPYTFNYYRAQVIGINNIKRKGEKDEGEKPELVSTIRRVGVLYCMLSQYGVDLTGMNKICSYVCADNKPFKGAKPENTVYTYLAHPEDRLFDKQDKIDYIKEKLDKYGVNTKGIPGLK